MSGMANVSTKGTADGEQLYRCKAIDETLPTLQCENTLQCHA